MSKTENIKGACSDAEAMLRVDFKTIRKQKAIKRLVTAAKFIGSVAAIVGAAYLSIRGADNEDEFDYGRKWMQSATDDELDTEREKVRVAFCSAGGDGDLADRLQKLLWQFDDEMSNRAWGGETPRTPSFHREHGWYLPNDD